MEYPSKRALRFTMEDDASVRKLVEWIFSKKFKSTAEVAVGNLSIPTCLLTNNFSLRIKTVLFIKLMILFTIWHKYVDFCCIRRLKTHEMYLASIIYACLSEYESDQSIFDSFIGVCALVKLFNEEIRRQTGLNFCAINTDIFMVLYDSVIKNTFAKRGGFQQLIEYIHGHRFLSWKWKCKNLVSTDGSNASATAIQEDISRKIKGEISKCIFQKITKSAEVKRNETSLSLAQKVLSTTSVELPVLPSYFNLVKRMIAFRRKNKSPRKRIVKATARLVESYATLQGYSNSNSNTNHALLQNEDNARYESIVQAVIRHNHSRSLSRTNSDNQIHKEADEILKRLKDTLKSLIKVLDGYDKD